MNTDGGIKGAWGIPLTHRKLCPSRCPQSKKIQYPKMLRFLSLYQHFAHGEPSGSEAEEFKPVREPSGTYNLLKTPRYAMELIRANVSSNLVPSLANALLFDLQDMDLLRPGVDVKDVVLDESKIDREKSRMKVKKDEKHKEDQEKLFSIGVDGKIDKDTCMYREVMDENGGNKFKKGKGEEHHLTFTKEPGTESGTYLTNRVIPVKGATAAVLSDEVHSFLKELSSVHILKAVLADNTNPGCNP